MVMNPEVEQHLFAERHNFDLVVYYNQNAQSLRDINNQSLYNLHLAIYELEFQKILRRAPMMLVGGFDAWRGLVGDKGIFKYATNDQNSQNEKQSSDYSSNSPYQQKNPHWLKDVVGRGSDQSIQYEPVKMHKTVYDYVSCRLFDKVYKENILINMLSIIV